MRQIYPKTYKNALKAYREAVSSQRGYLMIGLRCETNDKQRLRTGFFHQTLTIFINKSPAKKTDQCCVCFKKPRHPCKKIF